MESLIFTCLSHAATQLRETRLHPLQLLPVLPAARDEGEQVFLQEAGWAGQWVRMGLSSSNLSFCRPTFCHPQALETPRKHRKETRHLKVMRL